MTARTAPVANNYDHSSEVKKAEIAVAAAGTRITTADQDVHDAEAFRDQLLGRLRAGDNEITATELAAADATLRRAEALALGARDQQPIALTALHAAQLAAVLAEAAELAEASPPAVAEIREARAAVTAAKAHVESLVTAYSSSAREMGRRLRDAGADHVTGGAGDVTGWCGRPGENGSVLGFQVAGQVVADFVAG